MSRFRTMEAKEKRYSGESTVGAEDGKEVEVWTRKKILTIAFLCRMLMVFYGRIHDYLFEVKIVTFHVFEVKKILGETDLSDLIAKVVKPSL